MECVTLDDYQQGALRTARKDGPLLLANWGLGLVTESLELYEVYNGDAPSEDELELDLQSRFDALRPQLLAELGDVLWYEAVGCAAVGLKLSDLLTYPVSTRYIAFVDRDFDRLLRAAREVGEMAKKTCFHDKTYSREQWALAYQSVHQALRELSLGFGFELLEVGQHNLEKLFQRHGEAFTPYGTDTE